MGHMKHLRQYKGLWLLLLALVMGSLHVQAVYACSAMGEQLQATCCCEESASELCSDAESHSGLSGAAQACCEASLSAGFDDEAVFTPSAQQAKSGATPFAPPPYVPSFASVGARVPAGYAALSPDGQPASAIYLTTRRLRI